MIQEDYCSYEVAKLLKEKGFDEKCVAYYPQCITPIKLTFGGRVNYNAPNKFKMLPPISAPTHQMAMKWLREKGVYMSIDTVISSSGNIYFNIDTYSRDSGWNHPVDFYDSYEEAVEAACIYALKNLI